MVSKTSLAVFLVVAAFCMSQISAQTVTLSDCTQLDSSFLVNQTDLGANCVGLVLPSGVSPVCTNQAVTLRLVVYNCLVSFTGPRGNTISNRALFAQSGIWLNNMQYLNIGSSTTSAALAAAVQSNSQFRLFFGPQISLQTSTTTAFGSRTSIPTRGPSFSITSPSLTPVAADPNSATFVEYFTTLIRGPRASTLTFVINPNGGSTEGVDTDTVDTVNAFTYSDVASILFSNYPTGLLQASQTSAGAPLSVRGTCCPAALDEQKVDVDGEEMAKN
mmetsp:Transcript_22495/g.31338  ORF Transcript_22495/g.31338 Transcript_22495/m.31338 type:complete len:275 (-) Transcript_22495:92-916(-)